ncbi:MAG TPA: M48 family metalloprotease [Blastocatellia bacterium]|jgi:predicted Zn-dependent protease
MKFRSSISKQAIALSMLFALSSATFAQQKKNEKPLKDKENPLMIGKRDINKGNWNFYSADKELSIGRQLAAEVERKAKLITDPAVTEYVNRVAQNIILRSDAKIPFTIKIIDSPDINAFALPGGFLYVNTGLIIAADSEAELAGVMAHEIAHVTARHGVEQATKGALFQYLSIPLLFVGGVPGLIMQNAANILIPLSYLKFSRGAEEEADRLGLQYLWASGYDPTEMLNFFEKLKSKEKKKPGTLEKIFSTHPTTGKRLEKARALLVRFPERDEYSISTSEFASIRQRVLAITHQQELGKDSGGPTLKRKPTSEDPDAPPNPPTLKRKPASGN